MSTVPINHAPVHFQGQFCGLLDNARSTIPRSVLESRSGRRAPEVERRK